MENSPPPRILDEVSDADSDLEELQGDIAKFDESVREFLASQRGTSDVPKLSRGTSRGRGLRGPRKAAKPRGDITARLSKVNQAFLSGDYEQAMDLAFEVIRINAETHQAWTALASIFRERGEIDRALSAMVYAAHLRPKDVSGWLRCASFALDSITGEDDEPGNLHTARLCYSAALRADPTNIEARLSKADVCHRQGHLSAAITEYNTVLKRRPYDLDTIRKLAEACIDSKNAATLMPSAINAYRHYFDHAMREMQHEAQDMLWHDVGIYVGLLAQVERVQEAISELKRLSRWLLGRSAETFWDNWRDDDREWDILDNRRVSVPEFSHLGTNSTQFGQSLPLDLRVRLATYRLRNGDYSEAMKHLDHLDPDDPSTTAFADDFTFLIYDLGVELGKNSQASRAIRYFELLRSMPGDPDAAVLLQLGRCYLDTGESAMAEEYLLAALDADEDNIDARIELANMYEKAREDEEALILAAEALALRGVQDQDHFINDADIGKVRIRPSASRKQRDLQRRFQGGDNADRSNLIGNGTRRPAIPRRHRSKKLAGPDRRQEDEQIRALKLSQQYAIVRDLKQRISEGHKELIPDWMASSKELVDDFRSLKRFYSWDNYLRFLGSKVLLHKSSANQPETELSQMYQRLTRSIAPPSEQSSHTSAIPSLATHQGISFDDWLDLFLDYAIGLAIAHRRQEAYQVCQAAKDSTVFQSSKHGFIIHVAWSVCAIYTNDEERCVAIARHLMRDGATTDSYRIFSLLSMLCQSPASWYTSGPAQKYILRQIKAIDVSHEAAAVRRGGTGENEEAGDLTSLDIDICLLMLYGHILFTSTSYSYSLGYFLRARSLDPTNAMINLSLGLAYVHYGLKRQSSNRQYLILQGQSFLSLYARQHTNGDDYALAERYYNMGRLFQLLGIGYLSSAYYAMALDICKNGGGSRDLSALILANTLISLLTVGNNDVALSVLRNNLKL
ncbi:RNA polymerase III transcription initiation factor complex [Metarhizium robertsii ARSEF 23]|uniref:RNA polymerase III transcription initiation factor complex n=1 Tax=Metarhizium robertsii (strain ARSEF 23 / ATCC MYA-3075) TaxID=655844 RepID=E9EUD8_METRA|nr:RNA polymerase III transcription initiation factor complex [Metarhizium robertsii ARSEF 23]EFZ01041.2 RNA polymerase III transcription initiation factor complex [Metarhizium robertsii ARSEF 23]